MTARRSKKKGEGELKELLWAFRPPKDLVSYVNSLPGGRTANLVEMLEIQQDARTELGVEWFDLLKAAATENIRPGVAMARLVREALSKRAKKT